MGSGCESCGESRQKNGGGERRDQRFSSSESAFCIKHSLCFMKIINKKVSILKPSHSCVLLLGLWIGELPWSLAEI